MNGPKPLHQYLYEIGKTYHSKQSRKDKLSSGCVNAINNYSGLEKFKLSSDELSIVAAAWYDQVKKATSNWEPIELLSNIYPHKPTCVENLHLIVKLLEKQVFYSRKRKIVGKFDSDDEKPVVTYSPYTLLEHDISFHRNFLKTLLNDNDLDDRCNKPYENNKDYLNDWLTYIGKLEELSWYDYKDRQFNLDIDIDPANELLDTIEFRIRMNNRLAKSSENFPLQDIVREYSLDDKETIIIMYLVKEELDGNNAGDDEILKLISTDQHDHYLNRKYLGSESKLVRNGLIDECAGVYHLFKGSGFRLMPDVMRRIITNTPQNDIERLDHFIRGNVLFELKSVPQSFDELVLNREIKETIDVSIKRFQNSTASAIKRWGLFGTDPTKKHPHNLLLLFHGIPGTGKTFAAGAIANSLERQIIKTDASLIQSKWVGESEKNVKRIFLQYERLSRIMTHPPILLINEADQLFGSRVTAIDSIDTMYNSLQNLLLEGLENFPGILIATTNHIDSIDIAYSRRFHLKLELPHPGIAEMEQLWRLHLPSSIPGAANINCGELAAAYLLTGGQIDIIVNNAVTQAASRGGKSKILMMSDLIQFCDLETQTAFETTNRPIGFCYN